VPFDLTDGKGEGEVVGEEPNHTTARKAWSSVNHSILSEFNCYFKICHYNYENYIGADKCQMLYLQAVRHHLIETYFITMKIALT